MSRHARRTDRARGFTLVEVLIALVVLAIALGAVLRAVGQSIDMAVALRQRTVALWVAEDRLAKHEIRRDWIPVSVREGTSREGGQVWRWSETISSTPLPDFRRIDIRVRRAHGRTPLARLTGFLRKRPVS
ncbi:MAG: type II secretion system minor pseudopilin GspI [Acidiferrobacteraceae bacterium]